MASHFRLAFPGRHARIESEADPKADAIAPAAVPTAGPNPYVGPRPFELGERLWGRDEEIASLYYLLSAERIVLLHSPSGAGKSSLVQAGLIPLLRERFDVWRPTRVNLEPALAQPPAPAVPSVNRYVRSAILGFEEGIPPDLRRPPAALAGLSLSEYAAGRPRRPGAPQSAVLIFDQFEEVLTVEPLAVAGKEEFFDQLGELLHDARLWALFVLREDYLAPLDPYAERVPTHLRNRFRIDLLGLGAARDAIVNPAREAGRAFPVAEQLVHDLATMKIQQADGSFHKATGHHVEPVQLQVVCHRLWDAMPADELSIDAEDLERFGNVTAALAAYYAGAVERIAGGDLACERAIRDWFGERLITPGGIRAQVLMGAGSSDGLDNDLIVELRATHLVRAEKRAGATWFELAHDRLIEPVRSDNAAWLEEHLSPVQRRAALWASQGRPRGLLLTPGELPGQEIWTLAAEAEATQTREFVAASAEAQEKQQMEVELAQARRIRKLAFAAALFAVLALVVGGLAIRQWRQTEVQRRKAEEQTQIAKEQTLRVGQEKLRVEEQKDQVEILRRKAETDRDRADAAKRRANAESRAATLAREAAEASGAAASREKGRADEAANGEKLARQDTQRALARAYGEDAQRLLAADRRKEALAFLAQALRLEPESSAARGRIFAVLLDPVTSVPNAPLRHGSPVNSVSFSADGERVLTASNDGTARLWDAATGRLSQVLRPEGEVVHAEFSPDGTRVATASGSSARLWDAVTGRQVGETPRQDQDVRQALWSPDGRRLATVSGNDVRLWDPATGQQVGELPRQDKKVVQTAWSPDGKRLATAFAKAVRVWDAATGAALGQPLTHKKAVRCLAWSPEGKRLVTGAADVAQVWDVATGKAVGTPLRHKPTVLAVAFSPDGGRIVTGSADETARVWDVATGQQLGEALRHRGDVGSASFSPDGARVVTASADGTARIWRLALGRPAALALRHPAGLLSASFGPDGQSVVTAAGDGMIRTWDAATGRLSGQVPRDQTAASATPFPAHGRLVVIAEEDGTARVWDTEASQPLGEPLHHEGRIVAASFSPDGQRVVTASEDGTARVWDAATGRPASEPLRHDGWVVSAAFSPDGQRVVTASADGSARVWDVLTSTAKEAGDLARAAEIFAGFHVTERGSLEPIAAPRLAGQLDELRRAADTATEPRPTLAWFLRWYFTPRAQRAISPLASRNPEPNP